MKKCILHSICQMTDWSKLGVFLGLMFLALPNCIAQITISTDRDDASYTTNETVSFQVQSNASGLATYKITHDRYASVIQSGTISLQAGVPQTISFTSPEPAVVLCFIEQNGQTSQTAASISPFDLEQISDEPADFDAFWNTSKAQLAGIPIDPQIQFHNSTAYSTTYQVNLATVLGRRVYG